MSMNLYLCFRDSKGRGVGHTDLVQTPTSDTYWILGYTKDRGERANWESNPQELDHNAIKERYFGWLDEQALNHGWSEEILQGAKDNVECAYSRWTPDYEPDWSYI